MIDVACGQGVLCRVLHSQGVAVTGVDAAAELIRPPRQHGPAEIQYTVGDARDLSKTRGLRRGELRRGGVRAGDPEHSSAGAVFQSVARLLKPHGRLVIVMMHPCFRGAKETSWGWDEVGQGAISPDGSLSSAPQDADRYASGIESESIHLDVSSADQRICQERFDQAGFLIDAMEEWPSHKQSTSGPRAAAENMAREEIPMFLAVRAVKMPM